MMAAGQPQKKALDNFITNLTDVDPGYKGSFSDMFAFLFMYHGGANYTLTDLTAIDQSEKTCGWSKKP